MRVLVTRPQPAATTTAEALRQRGYTPIVAPLFTIEATCVPIAAEGCQAVIVTSANALRVLCADQRAALRHLPLYAVGRLTAEAARDAGFRIVHDAAGDMRDLARHIVQTSDPARGPLLYLRGEDVTEGFAAMLANAGYGLNEAVVYRAAAMVTLPASVIAALTNGTIAAALIFSTRAADAFLQQTAALIGVPQRPTIISISARAAAPFEVLGGWAVTVAEAPNEAAMLRALTRVEAREGRD